MNSLTPGQAALLRKILGQLPNSPKIRKAAVETAIVETGISNPSGGDADSAGWRQERRSLYPNPTNVRASARRFGQEAASVRNQYGSAGELAAAVQRPAAQYRGRYQQASGQADQILKQLGVSGGARPGASLGAGSPATSAPDTSGQRLALIQQFLSTKGASPVDLALGIRALNQQQATAAAPKTQAGVTPTRVTAGLGSSLVRAATKNADAINAKHLPYQWGGGHQGRVNATNATPLDCSGAVSAVLGINPRVASQFNTFGSPGASPSGKGITIYVRKDGGHVLMEIDGKFFGTSGSNPGGGAGWIPRSAIPASYLQGFRARHLAKAG